MECALCSCPSAREHSAQPRCFVHIISKEILCNKYNNGKKPETQKPVGWHCAVTHGNRAHFIERAFHSAVLAVLIIPQSVWDEYILGDGEIDEGRGLFYLVTYLFGCAWSYLRNPGSLMFLAAWAFSSCPQSFPASGSFPMSQCFTSGGQSIRVSASASVFPMNIQEWFSLGLTVTIWLVHF